MFLAENFNFIPEQFPAQLFQVLHVPERVGVFVCLPLLIRAHTGKYAAPPWSHFPASESPLDAIASKTPFWVSVTLEFP